MLLSVIIPTYNRARFLPQALGSLLAQELPKGQMEAVIVDDGSADGTNETVREFSLAHPDLPLTYIRQDHKGISAARNRGILESKGEWIAFLDSDDLWKPEKAARQLDFLKTHPEARIVFTRYLNFRDDSLEELSGKQEYLLEEVEERYLATALVRRSLFDRNGLFCERLTVGEDTEWVKRNTLLGTDISYIIEEPLYLRRIHEGNISLGHRDNERERHKRTLITALHMVSLVRNRQKNGEQD